jgi:uncharacterized protein (DUF362 family)
MSATVVVRSAASTSLDAVVADVMERLDWRSRVPEGGRVVIKPNLCTERPEQIEVANTDRRLVAAVCRVLQQRTRDITIGESDGIRYDAEAALESNGIYALGRELGLKVINFSREPTRQLPIPGMNGWGLPSAILDADCFITLPKLKTHATTVFTGALKNQWGCIPRRDRILLHKRLDRLIVAVNAALRPRLAIMDGLVAMQGRGPINGEPVRLDLVLGSADPVALDATAVRLIGLDPRTSRHMVLANQAGLGHLDAHSIDVDADCSIVAPGFKPARRDWAIKMLNGVSRSKFLTRHLLLNDGVFYPLRRMVVRVRALRAES